MSWHIPLIGIHLAPQIVKALQKQKNGRPDHEAKIDSKDAEDITILNGGLAYPRKSRAPDIPFRSMIVGF